MKVTRPWKVYDFWGNVKTSSFSSFGTAERAAFEMRLTHHDEVMPRISFNEFKGYAYVDKNGLIKSTHREGWANFIPDNGLKINYSCYSLQ